MVPVMIITHELPIASVYSLLFRQKPSRIKEEDLPARVQLISSFYRDSVQHSESADAKPHREVGTQ
jgi:hypothetical protein